MRPTVFCVVNRDPLGLLCELPGSDLLASCTLPCKPAAASLAIKKLLRVSEFCEKKDEVLFIYIKLVGFTSELVPLPSVFESVLRSPSIKICAFLT